MTVTRPASYAATVILGGVRRFLGAIFLLIY
jgi:hypothetical protein